MGQIRFHMVGVYEVLMPGCTGTHTAEGYTAEWSVLPRSERSMHSCPGLLAHDGDGSQAQSTCLTDEVYPSGHIRTQCGKRG